MKEEQLHHNKKGTTYENDMQLTNCNDGNVVSIIRNENRKQLSKHKHSKTILVELSDDEDSLPEERLEAFHDNNYIDIVCLSDSNDCDSEDTRNINSALTEGPLSKLWSGQTKPLLQPSAATSTARILSILNLKMDEKKSDSPQSDTFKNTERITNSQFKIIYDVFLPKTTFRKSTWCLPNYRIAVCKPINRLPTHSDVKLLTERYQDSVPLLFAVCSLSSVAFYCFSKVALPQMISQG